MNSQVKNFFRRNSNIFTLLISVAVRGFVTIDIVALVCANCMFSDCTAMCVVFVDLQNLVQTASAILDVKYRAHWRRVTDLTGETAEDLVLSFNRYIATLAQSQEDTYTSPFEVVADNMGEAIFSSLVWQD
jgi:hypothetical protein